MSEASGTVEIRNRHGLHARPAAQFVKLASTFRAEVMVRKDDLEVNGKSIMGVLMLAAEPGAELTIRTRGEDAQDALAALIGFLRRDTGAVDDIGDLATETHGEP